MSVNHQVLFVFLWLQSDALTISLKCIILLTVYLVHSPAAVCIFGRAGASPPCAQFIYNTCDRYRNFYFTVALRANVKPAH